MNNNDAITQNADTLAFWEYLDELQNLNFSAVTAEASQNLIFSIIFKTKITASLIAGSLKSNIIFDTYH